MNTRSIIIGQIFAVALCAAGLSAQTPTEPGENLNFGFTRNPPAKSSPKPRDRVVSEDPKSDEAQPAKSESDNAASRKSEDELQPNVPGVLENNKRFESLAQKTREIVREEARKSRKPVEIYKVGAGDVLFISLQESNSSYYTVLNDGAIDYPLAGGLVAVSGLTVEEIEEALREKVQLYENPDISVKVREYASHAIDVLGLVGREGRQYLQREAMPLYVIRARVLAKSEADLVVIKRNDSEELSLKVGTPEFDETLVYPGDVIEFASSAAIAAKSGFVYIGGAVNTAGRFGFHGGMTLTQAIMAAGGVENSKVKKAVIRRKDDKGFLESNTYKLSDIKKGKARDPELEAGDMIEVGS